MLIYEKRVKTKMRVVIPKYVVEALACDGTAMSSALDKAHLFSVFPKLRLSVLSQGVQAFTYDSEKEEHFALVEFDDACKFVPNTIYKQVHFDNVKFLSEKQVFSDNFYKCSLELL